MKKNIIMLAAISCLCISSCDDDDVAQWMEKGEIATVTGYSDAETAYGHIYTNSETVSITYRDAKAISVNYKSTTWGSATFDEVQVSRDGNDLQLSSNGVLTLTRSGNEQHYDCTLEGKIVLNDGKMKSESSVFDLVITLPTLMENGTVIHLYPGNHETEEDTDSKGPFNLFSTVYGSSMGYSSYFPNGLPGEGTNQVTISEGSDIDHVNVLFSSQTWGEITIEDANISKDGSHIILSGNGICKMGRPGAPAEEIKEYACELDGSLDPESNSYRLTFTMPELHQSGMNVIFTY